MRRQKTHSLSIVVGILIACFIFKLFLSAYFPLTGDEAYYQLWGQNFSFGYYDHTPFIGWFLWPFLKLSLSPVMLRLPCTLVTSIIGLSIYLLLRRYDDRRALLLAILFFISPLNLLGIIITTDIPLILFSFLSGVFLFLAIRENDHLGFYLLSGVCLGIAFFSKYFAVLLALAYFCYFLVSQKSWKRTFGFVIVFLCVLPFGIENLIWNYSHAWANILFNIYNRNKEMSFSWKTIGLYLLIIAYVMTPVLLYYFVKHFKTLVAKPKQKEFGVLVWALLIPLLFFLLLSTHKSIGLHWPLSFIPFVYLLACILFSTKEIIFSIRFMMIFTAIHLFLVAIILFVPVQLWQQVGITGHKYSDLVFDLKHPVIRQMLNQYEKDYVIASPSYAKADLMTVDSNVYSPTFGLGSEHGREGDFLTDYKQYKNKNFVILFTKTPELNKVKPYFRHVRVEFFRKYGAKFYLVFGYHLKYHVYRRKILQTINQRYWQVPALLPHTAVFYCKKYFKNCPANPI